MKLYGDTKQRRTRKLRYLAEILNKNIISTDISTAIHHTRYFYDNEFNYLYHHALQDNKWPSESYIKSHILSLFNFREFEAKKKLPKGNESMEGLKINLRKIADCVDAPVHRNRLMQGLEEGKQQEIQT